MNDSILIGQIVNIHGIKGEVKVYPYTDDIDNLSKLKDVYLDEGMKQLKHILNCKIHKNMLIFKFDGVDTPEDAELFRNKYIYIPKSSLKKLDDDSYYIEDIIGSQVIDENQNLLGVLEYVFNTGANDVFEVVSESGNKYYLPAIKQVIKKVDIQNKKIYIETMEGLLWQIL